MLGVQKIPTIFTDSWYFWEMQGFMFVT